MQWICVCLSFRDENTDANTELIFPTGWAHTHTHTQPSRCLSVSFCWASPRCCDVVADDVKLPHLISSHLCSVSSWLKATCPNDSTWCIHFLWNVLGLSFPTFCNLWQALVPFTLCSSSPGCCNGLEFHSSGDRKQRVIIIIIFIWRFFFLKGVSGRFPSPLSGESVLI